MLLLVLSESLDESTYNVEMSLFYGLLSRARWHGEVAVKILHVENPSEKEKSAFKYKVSPLGFGHLSILLLVVREVAPWV